MERKGNARLLGECILDIGPLIPALSDISGVGVRQSLKFLRIKDGKELTVGRFIISLRLVSDSYLNNAPMGAGRGVLNSVSQGGMGLAPPISPIIPQ